MSLLKKIFSFSKDDKTNEQSQSKPSESFYTIPIGKTAKEFGKINLTELEDHFQVDLTFSMEPQGKYAEGWQTGIALDGSSSMKDVYGSRVQNNVPDDILKEYLKKGWANSTKKDGQKLIVFKEKGFKDAQDKGFIVKNPNIMQPLAREFVSYLATNLDEDGGTTVIYWACGPEGKSTELLGDLTIDQCKTEEFEGPIKESFGERTFLLPAFNYFTDRFKDANKGIYLFLTDGKIDDLNEVKKFTIKLAKEIENGSRNELKCVLIGMGKEISEDQLMELDDLDTGTAIDIWDYKIASDMRNLVDIFAEVVQENQLIAPVATVYDSMGHIVKRFSDGLPAKISFQLPKESTDFTLEVGDYLIKQEIQLPTKIGV